MDTNDMDEEERSYWFTFWNRGAYAIGKLAALAHCLNLANQLQMNGAGFDIHIQKVSPSPSGRVTTTVDKSREFDDLQDLEILLRRAVEELQNAQDSKS
jgi:hypothetical protein